MPSIGENIKRLRIEHGMTQEQLAIKLNTTKSAISKYELGKRQPRYELVEEIAGILQIDPFELYFGTTREALSEKIDKESDAYWAELEENFLPGTAKHLVEVYLLLNEVGQKKAIERIEELAEIPKYVK